MGDGQLTALEVTLVATLRGPHLDWELGGAQRRRIVKFRHLAARSATGKIIGVGSHVLAARSAADYFALSTSGGAKRRRIIN